MATITFSPGAGSFGLSAYQKLREFKHIHETLWDESLMLEEVENDDGEMVEEPVPRKRRGRKIQDQKANAIADIATVLKGLGSEEGKPMGLKSLPMGEEDPWRNVEVRWSDMTDAEFAETWSGNVIHDRLDWTQNNRDPDYNAAASARAKQRVEMQKDYIKMLESMSPEERAMERAKVMESDSSLLKEEKRLAYEESRRASREAW